MVKLIRLTSKNNNGIFNNIVNTDIIIEKNSKIALCNFSAEIRQGIKAITSSADEVVLYIYHADPILYLREDIIK